jgi:hypothetical protein
MNRRNFGSLAGAWLTGGLAGSALTLSVNWITERLRRPQINILFDNAEPGCRIETNVDGGTEPVISYVRLKVTNSGRSAARGVSAYVTKLTFISPSVGNRIFAEDVLELHLAYATINQFLLNPFLLPSGAHRYIDLAHVTKNDLSYSYDFFPGEDPVRLRQQGFGTVAGSFGAEIFVSADNAEAARRFVTWS